MLVAPLFKNTNEFTQYLFDVNAFAETILVAA
jgi:hypothetical protein